MRILIFLAAGLLAVVPKLLGQPKGRVPPNLLQPGTLNSEEGAKLLQEFRQARMQGDYCFLFQWKSKNNKGQTVSLGGRWWGSWNESGPISRIRIEKNPQSLEYLLQNGPSAKLWKINSGGNFQEIESHLETLLPVAEEIQFTPFEMLMPFLYWPEYVYEGSLRTRGRPAHNFILYPPEGATVPANLAAVRITLDADFRALLQVDYLDASSQVIQSLRILSFKKIKNTWVIKSIDLVDQKNGRKTRFQVLAAAVDLQLPLEIFLPDRSAPIEVPKESEFIPLE